MNKQERIMRRAIEHYGVQAQRMMLIEELGELIQATKSGKREKVVEEMLPYLSESYGNPRTEYLLETYYPQTTS